MKAMLICLLVIGAVAMLETDVSAVCEDCGGFCCCYMPKDLYKLLEEVKKHESRQVLIITHPDEDPSKTLKVREELIKNGLPPEIIGELILEGRAPLRTMRKGQLVMVDRSK
jgi:hypothetical protein